MRKLASPCNAHIWQLNAMPCALGPALCPTLPDQAPDGGPAFQGLGAHDVGGVRAVGAAVHQPARAHRGPAGQAAGAGGVQHPHHVRADVLYRGPRACTVQYEGAV